MGNTVTVATSSRNDAVDIGH